MKLENLDRYEDIWGLLEKNKNGEWVKFNEVEELYNHQQQIINSLVSNSESQTETNKVLVNRLLEYKSWLETEIKDSQQSLDCYEDIDEEQFGYLNGIIEGLNTALKKIK